MKRLRPRVGLRLMLLLVALFCVLAATFRARLDTRRERICSEIRNLEVQQVQLEDRIKRSFRVSPKTVSELNRVNALIAQKQKQTGDTRNVTKEFLRREIQPQIDSLTVQREQLVELIASETNPDIKRSRQRVLAWIDAEITDRRTQISDLADSVEWKLRAE